MATIGFQTLPIESQSEPRTGRHRHSCGGCKTLTCDSIHGPVAHDCLDMGCGFCADLKTIDDEISDAYDCLLKLVKKRAQIVEKKRQEPYICCLPVELLSLIFVFVKKAHDDLAGRPSISIFNLPRYSPPLRVGYVCKEWRDIALRTPQLWTDIFLDLLRPVDAQLKMINKSARRSGDLPLNVSILLKDYSTDKEQAVLQEWGVVEKALRSFAARWNTVAIQAPWSICYKLLNQLEDTSSITSFHALFPITEGVNPIKLQHPLRPKYFYSWNISGEHIPVEWDNLVHLETGSVNPGELLHIVRYAQKLRHFVVENGWMERNVLYPMPTTPITNRSLIHFKTKDYVLDYLTLPSLQYFDCLLIESADNIDSFLDSVVSFLDRSQAPLQTFLLECDIKNVDIAHSLEKLLLITSLTVNFGRESDRIDHTLQALTKPYPPVILPHLQQLGIGTHSMSSSSWSLFSRLFRNDIQLETPGLEYMKDSVTLGRPLSKVSLRLRPEFEDAVLMDKTTFLHLLAVRKSGIELDIVTGWDRDDAFPALANLYDVKL